MRKVWLLASTVLAFLNFVKSQEVARTLYSARYDNLDIDTILGSNRLVSNYVDCLLSRKPCPPEGKDLKRILPEALRTKCARCSPIQKENALKIITRLYFDYPDQYRALRERWDPSGEYHRRFEDYLRGLQFNQIGGNGSNGGNGAGTGVGGGGNTVENGGNDRPVRNDLDRQPATQSSNVQAVVIDPTLAGGQPPPSGSVNTLLATPPPAAPATERPRPPAPVSSGFVSSIMANGVVQSLQSNATSQSATVRPDEVPLASQQTVALQQLAQQIPPGQQPLGAVGSATMLVQSAASSSAPFSAVDERVQQNFLVAGVRPVVDGYSTEQNFGTDDGNGLPQLASMLDVPTTTGDDGGFDELTTAPPLVVVNRFGEDAGSTRPSFAPAPTPAATTPTTTTPRPTTTVRQTRPVTRQTTTRNTQRTTNRFITRVPQTPPPTPPRTTTTSTNLPPRQPPRPTPAQQPPPLPQAPPASSQSFPNIIYQQPQAPPRATAPPPPRPLYVPENPTTLRPPPAQQHPLNAQAPRPQAYPPIVYQQPQAPPRATAPPPPRPLYVPENPAATPTHYATTPDSIIDHFFVPPSQVANAPLPPSPIVGLWNQLGTKIADTADAIAGMLQKTVDVLVSSHLQAHQRALRRSN